MNEKLNDFYKNMCISIFRHPCQNRYLFILGQCRNFSQRTVKLYTAKLIKFLDYCSLHSKEINSASFKDFIYHLKTKNKLSTATLKQSIGAVKFFFIIP